MRGIFVAGGRVAGLASVISWVARLQTCEGQRTAEGVGTDDQGNIISIKFLSIEIPLKPKLVKNKLSTYVFGFQVLTLMQPATYKSVLKINNYKKRNVICSVNGPYYRFELKQPREYLHNLGSLIAEHVRLLFF